MFSLILLLPFLSACTLGIFGSYIGVFGCLLFSCFNLFISWVLSLFYFFNSSHFSLYCLDLWPWAVVKSFPVFFTLKYDSLTAIIFIVVTTVSCVVHCYSSVYMYTDPFLSRFISYLSLFTFFMLLLVSSGNLLVLFIGWEGVGLCSFLLIGFWHTRVQAGKAAVKAFLINKVGDLFFLTGICLIFITFHSIDFSVISTLAAFCPTNIIELIAVFLFIGAVGKSAQVGLHTWLPDAIEGPTPVSALIHAATMVTAGVFLVIRCSPVFECSPRVLYLIALWGGLTALLSGTIGAVQNDIKKIIAYSTCSQLGYMILACGLSFYNVSFFHLFNHAFFKALLFLSAGSVIHLISNEQDIRRMGGLGALTPFLYCSILVGSLALAGFPFLAGFYSKDIIIEISNLKYWNNGQFLYWLVIIAAMLTIYYSIRLLYLVFIGVYNGFKVTIITHVKISKIEIFLLSVLGYLSCFSGYWGKDLFTGVGSNYFGTSSTFIPTTWTFINLEFIPPFIKLVPLFVSLFAAVVIINLNFKLNNYNLTFKTYFEASKWFYNEIINEYIALGGLYGGRHFFEQYEKRVLEYFGPSTFIISIQKIIK